MHAYCSIAAGIRSPSAVASELATRTSLPAVLRQERKTAKLARSRAARAASAELPGEAAPAVKGAGSDFAGCVVPGQPSAIAAGVLQSSKLLSTACSAVCRRLVLC